MADPFVVLTIKSTSGIWEHARFNRNNRAQKIVDEAVKHFPLDPSPEAPYVLSHDDRDLALGEKIAHLGLEDGDIVTIEAGQPIDG